MEIHNTKIRVICAAVTDLESEVNAVVAEGFGLYGPPKFNEDGTVTQVLVKKELLSVKEAAERFGTPAYRAEKAAAPKATPAAPNSPSRPARKPWQEPARVPVRPTLAVK